MAGIRPIRAGMSGVPQCHIAACLVRIEGIPGTDMASIVGESPVLHRAQHPIVRIAGRINALRVQIERFEVFALVPHEGLRECPFTLGERKGRLQRVGDEIGITSDSHVIQGVLKP